MTTIASVWTHAQFLDGSAVAMRGSPPPAPGFCRFTGTLSWFCHSYRSMCRFRWSRPFVPRWLRPRFPGWSRPLFSGVCRRWLLSVHSS